MSYIFLQDDYNGEILVAKESWFETMPLCQTYGDYGQQNDCPYDHVDDCGCTEVRAYNYWDGSNHKSAIISEGDVSSRYYEITDDNEIEKYTEAIENKERVGETTGITTYSFEKLIIRKSIWQGAWELFSIHEDNN